MLGLLMACTTVPSGAVEPARAPVDLALTDVVIVDVALGRVGDPQTVLIAGGRIAAIEAGPARGIPASAQRVDGRGRFLVPGLVDMHVHLFNNASGRPPNDWAFPLFLANGVTAVREMSANAESTAQAARWNQSVLAGELAAPRILAVGIPVRGPSPPDAARQVAEARSAGAGFIKVFSDVAEPAWQAIRDAACAQALPVVGHVPAAMSLLAAARDGLRGNEHLTQAYEACSTVEGELLAERRNLDGDRLVALRDAQETQALEAFDQATCDRVARALATTDQVQVPTMVLPHAETALGAQAFERDPRWCHLREDERGRWQRITESLPPDFASLARERWRVTKAIVSSFHRAGVPLLAGTDAPMPGVYPGFALQDELGLLVDAGLSPAEALRAATLAPARFLGLAGEIGSVEVGRRADLVLLDANPLQDIRNTRRIHAVLLGGRLLRRADLDEPLRAAAAACGGNASHGP